MAVKIKLKRLGKKRDPQYRIIVADARAKRDGRVIEEIGTYHPKEDPSLIVVDSDRAQYWLGVGAQPTEPVAAILRVTGDWQKFRGEPGAEGTLRVAEPRANKKAMFEAAAKESLEEQGAATTPKKKASKPAKAAKTDASAESAEVVDVIEVVEVAETPDGGAVIVDEVVEVIETKDAEVIVEDVVEVVVDAQGDVTDAVEVIEVVEGEATDATEAEKS